MVVPVQNLRALAPLLLRAWFAVGGIVFLSRRVLPTVLVVAQRLNFHGLQPLQPVLTTASRFGQTRELLVICVVGAQPRQSRFERSPESSFGGVGERLKDIFAESAATACITMLRRERSRVGGGESSLLSHRCLPCS